MSQGRFSENFGQFSPFGIMAVLPVFCSRVASFFPSPPESNEPSRGSIRPTVQKLEGGSQGGGGPKIPYVDRPPFFSPDDFYSGKVWDFRASSGLSSNPQVLGEVSVFRLEYFLVFQDFFYGIAEYLSMIVWVRTIRAENEKKIFFNLQRRRNMSQ